MRIVLACHNYPPHPGGLEVMVKALANGLAASHHVTVVSSAWDGVAGFRSEDGVDVVRLPSLHALERLSIPYPLPVGPGLPRALSVMSSADVLHAHGALYATSLVAASAARRTGCPLVMTEHVGYVAYQNPLPNLIQSIAWRVLGRFTVSSASALACLNQRVKNTLAALPHRGPIHFIRNGVDSSLFSIHSPEQRRTARASFGLPEAGTLVLFVGREAQKKNLPTVLAIPRDNFKLVVCGARRSLPANVLDLGVVPHERMPALLGAVDLMVHAATGEGFPVAVQEAMASGIPVVLLWDQGYDESLTRDVVFACDSLDDVCAALLQAVASTERRVEIGRLGRAWAEEHWTWATTVGEYEKVYRRVIDQARLPRDAAKG